MSPHLTLPATFRSAVRIRRRPGLRTVVVAPAVAVIVGMAIVVSNSVADELRRSATESAVHSVEAIVRGYVDPALQETSLDLDAPRDPAIDAQLERLTLSGEIRRINIWSRDGRIVYSSVAELRGRRFSIGPPIASAYAGEASPATSAATRRRGGDGDGPGRGPAAPCRALSSSCSSRSGVPSTAIRSASTTSTRTPGSSSSASTPRRSGVFVVAIVASSLLVAAHLAGVRRRVARARRPEPPPRRSRPRPSGCCWSTCSAARSASGRSSRTPRTASWCWARTARPLREPGRRADPRPSRGGAGSAGRSTRDVHPDDRAIVERVLADVAAASGSEVHGRVPGPPRRRLVANARGDRQEPPRRPGRRRRRRQLPRHHRAQGARGAAPPPGVPRRADRAGEPVAVPRPPRPRAGAGRPRGPTDRGPVSSTSTTSRPSTTASATPKATGCSSPSAQRLKVVTRAGDTVARLGGDEFAIIVEETEPAEAEQAAARILETLAPAVRARRAPGRRAGQHRDRHPVGGRRRRRRAAAPRRHRDVRGQGPRRRLPRHLRAAALRRDGRPDGAEGRPPRRARARRAARRLPADRRSRRPARSPGRRR